MLKNKPVHIIKLFLFIISIALLCTHAYAQKNRWTVKAGESIEEILGDSVIYRYPQFNPGVVHYKDRRVSHAPLNLNLITGEMQFISPSKDTLVIGNEISIDYITVQTDTFYFDKVYIELIHSNAAAKLGKIEQIRVTDIQKEGAFGQMSSTASIENIVSYYGSSHAYKLTEKSTTTLEKRTVFLIGNSNNNFLPAAKKNFNKMFGKKNTAISAFIKENKIVLTKENDLVKLIDFLGKI